MTFLQPFMFWAIPLVLLPVLIHLLNRMRYRPQPWAAMMFLLKASRHSVRHAKLRHFLLLACRVLIIAMLLLALARPLVGGWLGGAFSGAPDTIILLLDRSASMELQDAQTHTSKRERALRQLSEAARDYAGSSRFVLFENVARTPQEISSPAVLSELSSAGPTDSTADIPALLDAAVDYILSRQTGKTEIWLATDLQASNWRTQDTRWQSLQSRIASLPQSVRVRLLTLPGTAPDNVAVSLSELHRQKTGDNSELWLTIDLTRESTQRISFPLSVGLEGGRALVNVTMDGQELRLHHKLDLGPPSPLRQRAGGWGTIELPPDVNGRDNFCYFAFNEDLHLHGAVVAEDASIGRMLSVATAPVPQRLNQSCDLLTPAELPKLKWNETAVVVWAGALPDVESARSLRAFVEEGGVVVFFPPDHSDSRQLWDMSWGEPVTRGADKPARVTSWRNTDGPLAQTQESADLPVGELKFARVQPIVGEATVLAKLDDGQPLLVRRQFGKGAAYFCASLPRADWSNLGEGTVLVPILQRLLVAGGQRLGRNANIFCGDFAGVGSEPVTRLAGEGSSPLAEAGVYQIGNRIVAVNRPVAEDVPATVDEAAARASFGSIPFTVFEQRSGGDDKLQSELWRMFLLCMLVFLAAEAALALPDRLRAENPPRHMPERTPEAVEAEVG
jgi:hypothetical protein